VKLGDGVAARAFGIEALAVVGAEVPVRLVTAEHVPGRYENVVLEDDDRPAVAEPGQQSSIPGSEVGINLD